MVERIVLQPNETLRINTEARIVSLVVAFGEVMVYRVNANGTTIPVARLMLDEIYDLGYNVGEFELRNETSSTARIYIFSSYLF